MKVLNVEGPIKTFVTDKIGISTLRFISRARIQFETISIFHLDFFLVLLCRFVHLILMKPFMLMYTFSLIVCQVSFPELRVGGFIVVSCLFDILTSNHLSIVYCYLKTIRDLCWCRFLAFLFIQQMMNIWRAFDKKNLLNIFRHFIWWKAITIETRLSVKKLWNRIRYRTSDILHKIRNLRHGWCTKIIFYYRLYLNRIDWHFSFGKSLLSNCVIHVIDICKCVEECRWNFYFHFKTWSNWTILILKIRFDIFNFQLHQHRPSANECGLI